MKKLLIANRGEIALRVLRTATEMGLETVVAASRDDVSSLACRRADEVATLDATGAAAYLDAPALVDAARRHGCDALHPGYGFLSESAHLADTCRKAGIVFVGPSAATLALLGNKRSAIDAARQRGVSVLPSTAAIDHPAQAEAFFDEHGTQGIVLKAVSGGGGRGMRRVSVREDIGSALERCRREAQAAFGDDRIYAERFLDRAHHIEIQIAGDGEHVMHFGERDCSVQRRNQKFIEVAPSPWLAADVRARIIGDAITLASHTAYRGLGTFEFLVTARGEHFFIEANPRLQVEHTITEEVFGLDLVRLQLQLANGRRLQEISADCPLPTQPLGYAIQLRVNAETVLADGSVRPSTGVVARFVPPTGRGVRCETAAQAGERLNSNFDTLLAKIIVHSTSPRFGECVVLARSALRDMEVEGITTNRPLLDAVLKSPDFEQSDIDTGFVERHLASFQLTPEFESRNSTERTASDPLAVLRYGKANEDSAAGTHGNSADDSSDLAEGVVAVRAPIQGTVVSVDVALGDKVGTGTALAVLNAMKMEHVVESPCAGTVVQLHVTVGATIAEGDVLCAVAAEDSDTAPQEQNESADLDAVRPDLAAVQARQAATLDAARPDAVERRRKTGQRTARENLRDLCDTDSFVEYGGLAIAAQRQRRSLEDLIARTPADGMIAGVARINGSDFPDDRARCVVLSYDYSVLAGTQGFLNHRKKDRMFELAERLGAPVVIFTEGGGGRPGDTDAPGVSGLDCMAFHLFARLSGRVPLIGINSGRCFAGNAALLGCCDVVIATANSNIGMGGPAMIEGGGLGIFRPEEIGPIREQIRNGVVDIAVADEAEAVHVAKKYLAYFQGAITNWECSDQRELRSVVPENRLRVYEIRRVIEGLADRGSVLELRRGFGNGMVTAFARIDGRPFAVVANDPKHLSGAIDSAAADKAARFLQLCDAFDIPVLFLCDTPGIMVGPEAERTGLVRHASRLFVVGSNLSVPFCTVIVRKSYGLGAQAMGGGSHKTPLFTVSWPTGEFGGMGLEGAVKLGFRKELEAIEDPEQRQQVFEMMVTKAYERGGALNTASHFEIDNVIDPAETRAWVKSVLLQDRAPRPFHEKKRPCVDTW